MLSAAPYVRGPGLRDRDPSLEQRKHLIKLETGGVEGRGCWSMNVRGSGGTKRKEATASKVNSTHWELNT